MRKSRLYMAVASSIAAASLVPSLSWGFSIDASIPAPNVSTDSAGDTLVYPLYTTGENGGTVTSFSLTNTSPDTVVVTKIRFREQTFSMDAMDFMIVLSPNDKFDWTVSMNPADPRPKMTWKDNSCIVGPGQGAQSYMFPITNAAGTNNNSYVYDETAIQAGHIEVLGLAGLQAGNACYNASTGAVTAGAPACPAGTVDLYTAAVHGSNGVPGNCTAVSSVLKSATLTNQLQGVLAAGSAPNTLVGRYAITAPGEGIEGTGDAMAIQNSDLNLSSQSQTTCATSGNCTSRYFWDTRDYDHPHLGDMPAGYLSNFQSGLLAANVAGDWSNNPANYVGVDWMMSFPTKYLYLTALSSASVPIYSAATPSGEGYAGLYPTNGCLQAKVAAWGREEESGTAEEIVSPSPSATLSFCNETNVLTFQVNAQDVRQSYLATLNGAGNSRRTVVPFTVTTGTPVRGWSMMNLGAWTSTNGDSVSGIVFTTRNTDDPTINNGSISNLQKGVAPHVIP